MDFFITILQNQWQKITTKRPKSHSPCFSGILPYSFQTKIVVIVSMLDQPGKCENRGKTPTDPPGKHDGSNWANGSLQSCGQLDERTKWSSQSSSSPEMGKSNGLKPGCLHWTCLVQGFPVISYIWYAVFLANQLAEQESMAQNWQCTTPVTIEVKCFDCSTIIRPAFLPSIYPLLYLWVYLPIHPFTCLLCTHLSIYYLLLFASCSSFDRLCCTCNMQWRNLPEYVFRQNTKNTWHKRILGGRPHRTSKNQGSVRMA